MPTIDGVFFTDDEYREAFGEPGPDRPDFEARGYRDNYPDAVQDTPGHNYVTTPGHYANADTGGGGGSTDPLAGYSEKERDFLRRNQNPDGSYDFHRLSSAFVGDNQGGPFDRQGPMYDQRTNQLSAAGRATLAARQAGAPSGWSGGGGGGGDYASGGGGVGMAGAPSPYQPFTETFSAPTWADYLGPSAAGMPTGAGGPIFSFDPSKIADDPGYQFETNEAITGRQRYAAARGNLLTGGTTRALDEAVQGVAANRVNDVFGRQLGTWQQRQSDYGSLFGRARDTFTDKANIHATNEAGRFGSERANVLDAYGRDDSLWNRARTSTIDDRDWDTNLWNRQRMGQNDEFSRLYSYAGLGR